MTKKILITGCSSGLGYELTKLLLQEGNEVYGMDKNDIYINNALFHFMKMDLRKKYPDLNFIQFDIVISNLGTFTGLKTYDSMEYSEIEDEIRLNILIPLYITKFAKSKKYVFINSVLSQTGFPKLSIYCACKSFISTFNQSLRREGKDTLIVYPYKFRTQMFKEVRNFFAMDTKKVAIQIVAAIKKEKKELYLPFIFKYTHLLSLAWDWFQDGIISIITSCYFLI
ncbi:hypothetical protein TCON_1408 [Astathelohania contejeani]|uniref:Uncharacterized protein n=1 Tax=Astathelohania contejeani TaxID=164912 RepID=A0ABQ7HZ57_9MICR|nr:hypothetical protein TCON_1408 [Thelohania contejeani]